jgi:hypothetical protein
MFPVADIESGSVIGVLEVYDLMRLAALFTGQTSSRQGAPGAAAMNRPSTSRFGIIHLWARLRRLNSIAFQCSCSGLLG